MRRYLRLVSAGILITFTCFGQAGKKKPELRIIEATYGDQVGGKTCKADMSICKLGNLVCHFTVDEMCQVDSDVKNLEVTYDCGVGTEKKAVAAAKGTPITMSCEK
jgi:hypothetical protein